MQKAQRKKAPKTLLPRVIAISSGKGGVGKSSITVNLAISLAKNGSRVCLLDADTGLANANILLGLTPHFSLEHVLYGAKPIEDIMMDGPHGLKIIPGANGISECVSLHPRQQLRLTRELARIENDFDYMLIDTAAGIADTTLDFVSAAHHTLIVITPEPTSLTDAFSLIKLLKRRRESIQYQVVVNMCGNAGQAKEVFHRFRAAVDKYIGVELQFLGYILRDESMRAAVVLQNPVAMFPNSDPSCRSFIKLADALDEAVGDIPVNTSFSAYWHRQFREQRQQQRDDTPPAVQAVPEPASTQSRDTDYLSELRSRILLLIEQGQANEQLLEETLQESLDVFIRRFEHSPINPLRLLDELVQSPERNDQALREMADRLRPWMGFNNQMAMADVKLDDLPGESPGADDTAAEPPLLNNEQDLPEASFEAIPPTSAELDMERLADVIAGQHDETTAANTAGKEQTLVHHYDTSRFGSQEHLLDLLRRRDGDDQTVAEFLAALA